MATNPHSGERAASRPLMPVVLEDCLEGRLGRAIRHTAPVRLASLAECDRLGKTFDGGGVLIVRAPRAGEAARLERLRTLRPRWPHVVIYAFRLEVPAGQTAREGTLLRHSVDAVFGPDEPSGGGQIGPIVAARAAAPPPVRELLGLASDGTLSGRGRWVVLHVLRNAYRALSPDEVAAHAGNAPRTLDLELARLGLPAVHDVIRCARVLHGVELLRRGVSAVSDRA